jgi:hypothetical protein
MHACLVATGYNFRMQPWWCFFTFNLWQDWRVAFLAGQFLDYEPEFIIQIQMQSGTTHQYNSIYSQLKLRRS